MESKKVLQQIKDIVLSSMASQDVQIYLFGSWARGEQKQSSDVDIAIESKENIASSICSLREKLEESNIPYRIDLVDMQFASKILLQKIRQEGILWKRYKNA